MHSTERAVGACDVHAATRSRPPACPGRTARTSRSGTPGGRHQLGHRELVDGREGLRGRERHRGARRRAARARDEQVLVLSTGVIGMQLPMDRLLPGVDEAVAALAADGGAEAAEAIMTTDTTPKEALVARRRVHRRRHGKGRRDDPPRPRDDARGHLHRLPARSPARRTGFLRPAVERRSTRSLSTASARRTTR